MKKYLLILIALSAYALHGMKKEITLSEKDTEVLKDASDLFLQHSVFTSIVPLIIATSKKFVNLVKQRDAIKKAQNYRFEESNRKTLLVITPKTDEARGFCIRAIW
jgi:hypothetical protein